MTNVMEEDCRALACDDTIPWEAFSRKVVVVTGATGLIGQTLVHALLARERLYPTGMRVVALVRNVAKAQKLFGEPSCLRMVEWDAASPQAGLEKVAQADFIFHCANMTDSRSFVEWPVEVIQTTVGGAQAMLELARKTSARLCLLSTMETYGEVQVDRALREDEGGFLDAMVVRNSYPEAKRLDEALCAAYAAEHGVSAAVVRLTQTFGPGVPYEDNRVFAYFARCAMNGEDIVLLTGGTKKNAYLYTADAARALLFVAACGASGRAYNAANNQTFCEVREMARMVAREFGDGRVRVRFQLDQEAASRFRRGSFLLQDTTALEEIGWRPHTPLDQMYRNMLEDWREGAQLVREGGVA